MARRREDEVVNGQMSGGFPSVWPSLQREAAAGRTLPPVERWNPAHCGDIDIRIARDGTWFHQGTPIGRKELVRLFSTILRKDGDGLRLVTPGREDAHPVEDAPFLAVLLEVDGRRAATRCSPSPPMSATRRSRAPTTPSASRPIR